MMIYALNFLLAVFLAYFCHQIYPDIPEKAGFSVLIFLLWYLLLWLISFFYDRKGYFDKLPRIFGLIFFYLKELFIASLWVAYEVVTPSERVKPGIIAFPLKAETDFEITLLANMITLTPGTLSIDVSDDRKTLYVHDIYIKDYDYEKKKRKMGDGFEKKILKITRENS